MHTDLTSHHEPTTLVLLDPTHHDGETVLDELHNGDTHVAHGFRASHLCLLINRASS